MGNKICPFLSKAELYEYRNGNEQLITHEIDCYKNECGLYNVRNKTCSIVVMSNKISK